MLVEGSKMFAVETQKLLNFSTLGKYFRQESEREE